MDDSIRICGRSFPQCRIMEVGSQSGNWSEEDSTGQGNTKGALDGLEGRRWLFANTGLVEMAGRGGLLKVPLLMDRQFGGLIEIVLVNQD